MYYSIEPHSSDSLHDLTSYKRQCQLWSAHNISSLPVFSLTIRAFSLDLITMGSLEASDPSMATYALNAPVTRERKLNLDLQSQLPKPCMYSTVVIICNIQYIVLDIHVDLLMTRSCPCSGGGRSQPSERDRREGSWQHERATAARCILWQG